MCAGTCTVVRASAINCLERLVSVTYYVSGRTHGRSQ